MALHREVERERALVSGEDEAVYVYESESVQ